MTEFSIDVEIAAPPARVWAVMRDIERWHEWTSTITSITPLQPGPLTSGLRARIRQPKLLPAVWTVTAVDEGRGFTWETRYPGMVIVGDHRVEPAGVGSRAILTLRVGGLVGPLIALFTRRLSNRYLAIEAAGLKLRSEDGAVH